MALTSVSLSKTSRLSSQTLPDRLQPSKGSAGSCRYAETRIECQRRHAFLLFCPFRSYGSRSFDGPIAAGSEKRQVAGIDAGSTWRSAVTNELMPLLRNGMNGFENCRQARFSDAAAS